MHAEALKTRAQRCCAHTPLRTAPSCAFVPPFRVGPFVRLWRGPHVVWWRVPSFDSGAMAPWRAWGQVDAEL